jgi:ribose transport system ATP-binding protein
MVEDTRSQAPTATETPILRVASVSKTFPGTKALDDVSFSIRAGEVHALVGTNGSGKSTLIKVLAGFYHADPGSEAWVDGEPFHVTGRATLHSDALRFVHQDLGLVLELNTLDNLALHGGFQRSRMGRIDWRAQRRVTEELLAPFDLTLDVMRPLSEASPVERTVVAIAAALQGWQTDRGVLVLDEPTAVLPPHEVTRLFKIINDLRRRGTSVLYVSHRLDEIFELADRVTVLRGGRHIVTEPMEHVTKSSLVAAMLGVEMEADYRADVQTDLHTDVVMEVRHLFGRFSRDVSLSVRRGEILGLAGLAGSGREEVPYALAGALPYPVEGEVRMPDVDPEWKPAGNTKGLALAFVPADRGTEGVIDGLTVAENITLSVLDKVGRGWFLSKRSEAKFADEWAGRLSVKMADSSDPVATLSGGNQQKVLIGRCLATKPEVLVLCEPTAGVDIGARRGIYELLAEQSRQGLAVIVSSTDLDDLLTICTRVLVFQRGVVTHEFRDDGIVEYSLVHAVEGLEETEADSGSVE